MNVLILTPDAVGSTLLQRLITIYMQFHGFDRPVINLHELSNGLVKYYNDNLQQEVVGKQGNNWGYHQTLQQIVELLSTVDHYKTSRLAHYHIKNRQDSIADQISFYQYLNDNFYIISCRRHNVFEHALSWCLNKITKKLNVYNGEEKINSFFELYKNGIDIDPNSLIQSLNAYRDYINWCNNHFNVANYFYYDEHLPKIEKYILSLPIFSQQPTRISWNDKFGIDFDTWNRCQYLSSDIGTLALDHPQEFKQLANATQITQLSEDQVAFLNNYRAVADPAWPCVIDMEQYYKLPENIRQEVESQFKAPGKTSSELVNYVNFPVTLPSVLPAEHIEFIARYQTQCDQTNDILQNFVNDGLMISAPPIKKQTLAEKKHIIQNYKHLLDVYNQWVKLNPDIASPLDTESLDQFAQIERARWDPSLQTTQLVTVEQTTD
jgi:hypothetical protein